VEKERAGGSERATFGSVYGPGATVIRASDLTLDRFLPAEVLSNAVALLPVSTGEPRTVLLTGANGYLGKFLALDWLQRLSTTDGTLICLVRGNDVAGPNFGLEEASWQRLAQAVDLVVHPVALVNHVLPYSQLFGPNVVGTAEVIRLALTARLKPVSYVSTVSVAMTVDPASFEEDGDIRTISAERPIDDSYANGYGNSKWVGEVLLREAHDLTGRPVSVFRSGTILAHRSHAGQVNLPDMFTRLIISVLATGLAPTSFLRTRCQWPSAAVALRRSSRRLRRRRHHHPECRDGGLPFLRRDEPPR
jgi:fatty acid CoA ligase FadD9